MKLHKAGLMASALLLMIAAWAPPDQDARQTLRDAIAADSLQGHLSFISSDLLEGRDTPSRGLDIAAEYIAAQLRRAGLEPLGDAGYFQTTTMEVEEPKPDDRACTIHIGDEALAIDPQRIAVLAAARDVQIEGASAGIVPFPPAADDAHESWPQILITSMPAIEALAPEERQAFFQSFNALTAGAEERGVAAIINIDPVSEPLDAPRRQRGRARETGVPIFMVHDAGVAAKLGLHEGRWTAPDEPITIDLRYHRPGTKEVPVRNVAGLLRGSDPDLADTYVLVTAHYDHVGIGAAVEGDSIYNGANDDGSGTVSVIELASAFAALEERPRRSLLFMCFYGEERGLLGSRYYVGHPLVPLADTIANVNLEHMGRTDDVEGATTGRLMMTGYDYSDLISRFADGAKETGIELHHHPLNSTMFFARSDNVAFALAGVPAHTFAVSFIFPDYHGAGDHWGSIDFANMERVVETVALGLLDLANDAEPVQWNLEHARTDRYIDAWKKLHGVEDGDAADGNDG